ncbi:SDR family NAD(P)-dependent oxidoreductase [Nonomuraea fuscirosea]|uniref:SDR family NAD(P)-dependent oxidoreductase n=1 Tax=Nonomuraea fuscirosea TaxID=1291556 RepID=UPI0033EC2FFC
MTSNVALVTGASRGLGTVIARRLAADGFAVAVNYSRNRDGAERVAREIRATGGTAETFAADVTDESSVAGLVAAVAGRLGPVTVLVANATGPQPSVPVTDLTWQDHLDQLTFFVKSPTLLVQAVLPGMSAYTAAKGAQHAITEVWAKELGPYGITVNVVAPGWIPVERHAGLDESDYLAEVPLGRMGTPEDVAAAVAYLASEDGAFVTGQRITVNGGHT